MATKNTILGTVPKSRGRYTEGDTTTKWYYDNILEYKGSSFRCISEMSTGITGAPATYNSSTHTLVPNTGWEFFVDTTGALDVEERLAENEEKLSELETEVIYDVTANNNGMTFASLSALISSENLSILIPIAVRCGGMSIRFVQSSDNNYAQYRYMSSSTTAADFINIANWQGVDDKPTAGSNNLIKSGSVKNLDIQVNGDFSISFDVIQNKVIDKSFDISLKKNAIITLNTTTDLVSDINVYKNTGIDSNLIVHLFPNQKATFTLTEDIEKLIFTKTASGVIGTGTISISGKQTNNIGSELHIIENSIKENENKVDVANKTLESFLAAEDKAARDSYNLFDYTKISDNVRLKGSSTTGIPKSASGYYVSDFIEVKEGELFRVSFDGIESFLNGYCTYDASKQGLQYIEYFGNTTIPAGTKYIRFEAKHTLGDYTKLQIQKNQVTSYEPYGAIIVYDVTIPPESVKIKADGTGDYTSIRQAFETEGEGKTYEIYEGTYNVVNDFTAEEIANASYSSSGQGFVGIRVPNNSKVIGIGNKTNIIIKLELDAVQYSYTIRENIATLNLFGNCEIENITVLAINARTPIHDDFKASANSKHILRNCIFKNTVVERITSHSYGLGLRSGLIVEMYECDIYPSIICHSNVSFSKSAYFRMENCNVYGTLALSDDNSGVPCNVTLLNTSFSRLDLMVPNETQYMNIFLNTECKGFVAFSGVKSVNGFMFSKYPAKPAVTAGDCVSLYADSHSIPHCQKASNDFESVIGIALFDAVQGEMTTILRINKYIDANICGITGDYGQSVSLQNGRLVVGDTNVVGKIINYGGTKCINIL